jgi:hypothetical protein
MIIDSRVAEKTDSQLERVLREAVGDEKIRVLMLLRAAGIVAHESASIASEQFASRRDYRQAMIEQRKKSVEEIIGGTRQALKDLKLVPKGAAISRTVLVEGSAKQILHSLSLPGVEHASLDQPIATVETRRKPK